MRLLEAGGRSGGPGRITFLATMSLANAVFLAVFTFFLLAPVPASAEEAVAMVPGKDLVLKADAVCTRCHDETEAYPVLSIGRTRHGTQADGRIPTCTSCHGESRAHLNKPEGAVKRLLPDRVFSKDSPTPADVRTGVCLTCHQDTDRMMWAGSKHQTMNVACNSCHQVHTDRDKVRNKLTQPEVCFTCHKTQRTEVHKPSHHPILEGKVTCSDCHNSHGSAGPKLMTRNTVNDTCYQCHAEKRGPFLWNHQPVSENCSYCHNPHGSTVANLLKFRSPFLCQQCHEATSHRGAIPSTVAGNTSGRVTMARGCVNCHTSIHGGNNPTNNRSSRTFRR